MIIHSRSSYLFNDIHAPSHDTKVMNFRSKEAEAHLQQFRENHARASQLLGGHGVQDHQRIKVRQSVHDNSNVTREQIAKMGSRKSELVDIQEQLNDGGAKPGGSSGAASESGTMGIPKQAKRRSVAARQQAAAILEGSDTDHPHPPPPGRKSAEYSKTGTRRHSQYESAYKKATAAPAEQAFSSFTSDTNNSTVNDGKTALLCFSVSNPNPNPNPNH